MGTGWRRAFCTTIPTDSSDSMVKSSPTPRTCGRIGFFKSTTSTPRFQSNSTLQSKSSNSNNGDGDGTAISNASTPRMSARTDSNNKNGGNDDVMDTKFQSSIIDNLNITPRLRCKTNSKSPKSTLFGSNPSSPRSPFSIFKASLGLSRSNCGVCMQSVKTGHKTAIYTAECSHSFHFPCIASHVKKENCLVCPVCKSSWRDVPLLALNNHTVIRENFTTNPSPKHESPKTPENYVKSKAYDDDEALRTPRAGVGDFVPIPEAADEDVDEEVEEFKGFFVNSVSSSTADESGRDSKNVEVMLMPEVAVVSASESHETYAVVLKVKAPPPPPPANNTIRRAAVDLVAVLDVSDRMGGAKLHMLKRAMRLVISSLGSADRLSIVAFSASPKRLLPLKRMTAQGQRSARRIIERLACSRGACAGEALRKATKILEDRREKNPVATIILLSDGREEHVNGDHPNQRPAANHVSSTRFAHVEIPVSHEPLENAFTKCVGGLLSVVTQCLQVQLGLAPGSDQAEITAVYSCNGKPAVLNPNLVRFGDLYAEEEKEILIELRVPRSSRGTHHVLSVRCSYNDPATQEMICGGEKALLVPRAQAVRSSCSPKIERLKNLFVATRAVAESRMLVAQDELTTAHQLLSSARALLMQSMGADDFVKGLEAELDDVQWRVQYRKQLVQQQQRRRVGNGNNDNERGRIVKGDENEGPLTPTSAWRAAEKLAKVAAMRKALNQVSDLHGFENARF